MPSEEFSDTFATDTVKDIAADLFGISKPETVESSSEIPQPALSPPKEEVQLETKVEPAINPAVVPGQNSVAKPLPKSWKKDMAPEWEKLPPAVHDYVYAREADVMRGIQQYQTGHNQWDALVKPFAPVLSQHPDVDPVPLLQGLMNSHLTLMNPSVPNEKKVEFVNKLLRDYGIQLPAPDGSTPPPDAAMAEIRSLRQELLSLKSGLDKRQQSEYQAGLSDNVRKVEAFFADPANEFADELGTDIHRFIQTGAATDLASAYEMACWANPAVRAKMIAKQQSSPPAAKPRKTNGQFINVEGSPDPTAIRNRKGSIDDTINAVVASHYSKH